MRTVTPEIVLKRKAEGIKAINDILIKFHKEPLNTNDFDILFELSIEELGQAKLEVSKHLQMLSFEEHS